MPIMFMTGFCGEIIKMYCTIAVVEKIVDDVHRIDKIKYKTRRTIKATQKYLKKLG